MTRHADRWALALLLLAAGACSAEPKQAGVALMLGPADVKALCGPAARAPKIESESFPLEMRKLSTRYEDADCGIVLNYRLYTYSSVEGAREKFQAYQATYEGFPEGFDKRAAEDGQRLEYVRADGKSLAFLSQAGVSLISGSVSASATKVEGLRGIVQANSQRLGSLTWDQEEHDE